MSKKVEVTVVVNTFVVGRATLVIVVVPDLTVLRDKTELGLATVVTLVKVDTAGIVTLVVAGTTEMEVEVRVDNCFVRTSLKMILVS